MSEAISFWLDNKMVSARKVAEVGNQVLVDYRGKFYVVINGTALMKGARPLHYSKTSMPTIWKKAIRGEVTILPSEPEEEIMPMVSVTRRVRMKKEKEAPPMPDSTQESPQQAVTPKAAVTQKSSKSVVKSESRPIPQAVVTSQCPYCNQKHEIPVEKGKNGKPFFVTCTRCATDFAVRFVPVTIFQAQTAGFR